MLSNPEYESVIGVAKIPQVEGGLLVVLLDMERAGVVGYAVMSEGKQSVSIASGCPSCWYKNAGFCCKGRGVAIVLDGACG